MTYAAYETSIASGEPILLYDFFIGLAHWRYTSADRNITYLSNVYSPIPISSGSVNQGQEIKKKSLPITVPLDALVVSVLQDFPPSGDFLITIIALHQTDPDQQGYTCFVGRVMSQKQEGAHVILSCEPAYTGIKATGLRRRFQLNCAHVLYGVGCNLSAASFVQVGTISSIAGGTVISCVGMAPPTGLSFDGGYIEWDSGLGYLERRSIVGASEVSGTAILTLAYGSPDLVPTLAINAYPGCDHTTTNCTAFGNILNYGGQPYIPTLNPLIGNPVY